MATNDRNESSGEEGLELNAGMLMGTVVQEPADGAHEHEAEEKVALEGVDSRSTHSISTASQRTDHDRDVEPDNKNVEEGSEDPELALALTQTPVFSVFTLSQKRYIVLMVAMAGFFSPLSANIYFPALNTLAAEFNVSNSVINLTLTSYMIFQGLAPTIFGDLSDMAGRRPAYMIAFTVYIGACIGIACCNSYAALLVLRCLQSSGSSGTIALASGVVADIATSAERGTWMGWATSGPMVAPALAPVLGGLFAQFVGWRWIFWFLVILTAAFLIPFLITFPETGRNVVGNGSIPPQAWWNMSLLNYLSARLVARIEASNELTRVQTAASRRSAQAELKSKRKLRFPNPLSVLPVILEKDVGLLLFYNSLVYCAFYDVMASFPTLLEQIYGYDALQIGLCFLPFGVGCFIAPSLGGKLMDWNFRRTAKKIGYTIVKGKANDLTNFPIEKCRFGVAFPLVCIGDAALLCYGWVMHVQTSLAAPLILQFIIGLTLTGAFNSMSVMLVDLYPQSPATATSANNLVRCLMGAGATGVIIYMIDAMGVGWCFTFIAGIVALFSPIMWILERWGPGWREARRIRIIEEKRKKAERASAKAARVADAASGESEKHHSKASAC